MDATLNCKLTRIGAAVVYGPEAMGKDTFVALKIALAYRGTEIFFTVLQSTPGHSGPIPYVDPTLGLREAVEQPFLHEKDFICL